MMVHADPATLALTMTGPAVLDFKAVYVDSYAAITAALEPMVVAHPIFGPIFAGMDAAARQSAADQSRDRILAALAGDWDPYETSLRRDGVVYARLGIQFEDWYALTTAWTRAVTPIFIERFAGEPHRLAGALLTMQVFLSRAMSVLGSSYIKASEEEVRSREEDLAATLQCAGAGVITTDGAGHVTRMNASAEAIIGLGAPAIGQPLASVFRARSEAGDVTGEHLVLTNGSGVELPIHCSRAVVRTGAGQRRGEVIVFRDVSSMRRRQRELARWEALFQRVGWGIMLTDESGLQIATANPAFLDMYGVELGDVVGQTMQPLHAPGEYERMVALYRPAAQETGHADYESMHQRKDGSTFPVRVEAARIPGPDGAPIWVVTVHDLTDRAQAASLRARAVELELENRKIQEASRLKSEFLANMSHELRTPLNSILGFSSLLIDGSVGALAEQQREFIGDIHTSGQHLLRLINDVLDLSKVEAGRMEFQPEPTDLERVASEVVSVLRGVAMEKRIEIAVSVDAAIGSAEIDPARLKQVLYNLLSNACKFSPSAARVELRIVDHGAAFRVEVSDEGPGVPEKELKRLFTEFEQLDASRTKMHAGTGLGLALTRGLVEAQGGSVGVHSKEGAGSVFWAILPKRTESRGTLPHPRQLPGPSTTSPRVLVIEDDASDQERIVQSLLRVGYAIDVVATGAQALRAAETRSYDAITLDLLLPDMSGLDVLRAIRASPRSEATPVIVVSLVTSTALGGFVVHDVLSKPVPADTLVEALARAGVRAPARGPVLVVDDDQPSARLMAASLERCGLRALIAQDGALALELAAKEMPVAVVLDLVMPNLDGVAFLDRVAADDRWRRVPIFVWSVKELTRADHAKLLERAAAVFPKDGASVRALVDLVERHVPATSRAARGSA